MILMSQYILYAPNAFVYKNRALVYLALNKKQEA